MKERLYHVGGWLLLTVFAVFAAGRVDWPQVLAAAADARPLPLITALILNATILFFATVQWMLFLPDDTRVDARRMFEIVAITSTVSNGGPWGAGGAVSVHLLATHGGAGHAVGLSVLLLDQVVEGISKAAIVLLAVAVVPIGLEYRAVGATIIIGVPLLLVVLTVAAHRSHVLESLAERSSGLAARLLGGLHRIATKLEALRDPTRLAAAVALGLAQKLVEVLAIAAVAAALGVSLPWWGFLAVLVAVSLSTLVSVTPANLGLYEGSAFLVYRALGVGPETAVALAILQHTMYLIPLAGIGWVVSAVRPIRIRAGRASD